METILVVEDKESMAAMLKETLEAGGYAVVAARDGQEGIRSLRDNRIDLVITDLTIPLISGIGLISHLKEQSPQTPIIIMTGWSDDPVKLQKEAKADTVLMKPFELEELDLSVSKLLSANR
jgi:DNA-binding response OmpR family regulator